MRGNGEHSENSGTRLCPHSRSTVIHACPLPWRSTASISSIGQSNPPRYPSSRGGDLRCTHVQNRHCACVYYQDWHRSRKPKPAAPGGTLPAVNKSLSPATIAGSHVQDVSPRNTLSLNSGIVIAVNNDDPNFTQHPGSQPGVGGQPPTGGGQSTGLSFDEEAKLVYGVVLSLRNMIKKLSGKYVSPVVYFPRSEGS